MLTLASLAITVKCDFVEFIISYQLWSVIKVVEFSRIGAALRSEMHNC
jgi:hypothetical protein